LDEIYMADSGNNHMMRWCEGTDKGSIIVGENGKGKQSNQCNSRSALSFDLVSDLYITDSFNNRIQKFEFDFN
jgi:hypothetical protein